MGVGRASFLVGRASLCQVVLTSADTAMVLTEKGKQARGKRAGSESPN